MMILIPIEFTLDAPVILSDPAPQTRSLSRRVSRVATLGEEGVWIGDFGYHAGDRTLTVSVKGEDQEMILRLEDLLKSSGQVVASTDNGIFLCAISALSASSLTLFVKEEPS